MSCKSIQVQPSTSGSNNNPHLCNYSRQNPSSLSQMTLNTICKSLRTGVKKLDQAFEKAHQEIIIPISPLVTSSTSFGVTEDTSMSLMLGILKIKRYIQNHLTPDIRAVLLEHALTYSVLCKTVAIIRFIIVSDIQTLDLFGLDCWRTKNTLPSWWEKDSEGIRKNTSFSEFLTKINPPNEFDWYSADRMGRVVSFSDVIELFSILKSAKCQTELKTLKINARRESYASVHKNYDSLLSELFSGFTSLTTLALRGMADDNLLKTVGNFLTRLKVLDVSYSKFVTDEGIKHLFCRQITTLPLGGTLATWIQQNANLMNSVRASLYHLDFSYTNVTQESLAFVRCIPGSFLFQRSFALSEKFAFGHVIFLQQKAIMSRKIMSAADPDLGLRLENFIGKVAKAQFDTLVETLHWETKHLNLFRMKGADKNRPGNLDATVGIVTSGDFVSGMFKVTKKQIKYLYSNTSFPVNLLGGPLIHSEVIQGIVEGIFDPGAEPYFTTVTIMDLFAQPCTIYSILKHFSNLVSVKFRVIFEQIVDEDMVKSIATSKSKNTLREFWTAPGSYKPCTVKSTNQNQGLKLRAEKRSLKTRGKLIGQGGTSEVDQLCNLSVKTAKSFLKVCKSLRRLGDLAWWSLVSSEELALFCRYLQKINSSLMITFDDILLPDFELVRDSA